MKTIIAIITLAALTGCATNLSPEERQRRAQAWMNFLESAAAGAAVQQMQRPVQRAPNYTCSQHGQVVSCSAW